jgi:2-oxoglutarate dehydrogenase E1 component
MSALEAVGGNYPHKADERKRALNRLTAAEGLERYLHTKYVGQKRFSLEGGDSADPADGRPHAARRRAWAG